MSTRLGDSFVNEQAVNFLTRDAWQDWTPVVDQGGAVARTVNYARYTVIADVVHLLVRLTITGAGAAGSPIVVSGVPIAIADAGSNCIIGVGNVVDSGTAVYTVSVNAAAGGTSLEFYGYNVTSRMGVTPSFGLANNDVISFQATYKLAW